ncbi:hypothetical protein PTMSG1_05564 [Pyrenophora teres f. maculata]|nr:hypothetical protein PTMSG1_05564 [Pyrenophora teres f. maculata]
MGKPGLGLFTVRRKSQGNVMDDVPDVSTSPDTTTAPTDAGGFRLLSRTEVEKAKEQRKTQEKSSSKFPRFTGFGHPGSKNRNHDSKSSSGTQFSNSRPYANGQHGSTSTLPSSTDTSSDDNLFANVPRPSVSHHNTSPATNPLGGFRKQLPSLPKSNQTAASPKDMSASGWSSRNRALTTSSYASTAVPPKLDGDLDFGGFEDDMFSHLDHKQTPEIPREIAGRSLLSEKRTFQANPIKIDSQLEVEPPLKSWDSRNSTDNLMASTHSDDDSPPPPPPPAHKYSSYAPIASESPTLGSMSTFHDPDAQFVRKSFIERQSYRENSPETQPKSMSSSSANSYETPYSSRSATASSTTTNTTPKASLAPAASPYNDTEEDDLFTTSKPTPKPEAAPQRKMTNLSSNGSRALAPATADGRRVMSQAEFREYQKKTMTHPPQPDSSDDEDYEDEEDAIKRREEEELMRRKNQQMHFAREAMRRSTTAPSLPTESGSVADGMGFPSETSMKAEEWEDEDVPLGILAQHGFPSQTRNRFPSQPTNAMPSYIPDRPASAGALGQRAPQANLPAFARHLPQDPYSAPYIGGGLVRPMNRESMGFNGFARGPGSVAGDSVAGGMATPPMMYQDAGMSQPSLVDQIQMRDMTKQKYMGGASAKKPQGGPFTGILGQQMNTSGQPQNPMRMPHMPMGGMNGMNGMGAMAGMNGMNPMMNMMGGQMPMGPMGGMGMGMGMGMGQMPYPMQQGNDYMQQFQQMQQMIAMQQMQLQMMQQPQQQDARMSMATSNNGYAASTMGGASFLNVPSGPNRPMSIMSGSNQNQQRTMSLMGPHPGYTPSIAPSERSNIGLSARYRPVVNQSDSMSNGTSMTLQASSGGANQNRTGVIKGILKKGSPGPQMTVNENDDAEEDWGKMAARKTKHSKGKENHSLGLEDLTRGLKI